MALEKQPEAEREFRALLDRAPEDLLSCAQLGFLYLVRDEKARAMPLLEKVLRGPDVALANRVRAALKMPLLDPSPSAEVSGDNKVMAERSLKSGYLRDALQYLQAAHAADPTDGWVMLKLGWTYNILHADELAFRWFRLARSNGDPAISAEADKAYRNLRPTFARFRTTAWVYPFFSTRWHDAFAYGQIKSELRLGKLPFRPYLSVRLLGDARRTTGGPVPQDLSENSGVVAVGIASSYWRGMMLWGEAGSAISYLDRGPTVRRVTPDYRGGVSFGRGFGHGIGGEEPGWFFETNADAVYVSRYENDLLLQAQTKIGLTPPRLLALETQFFWNSNFLRDVKGLEWANFVESGPGMRFRWAWMPRSLLFTVSALRGSYSVTQHYREQTFVDLRMGFWYAITR